MATTGERFPREPLAVDATAGGHASAGGGMGLMLVFRARRWRMWMMRCRLVVGFPWEVFCKECLGSEMMRVVSLCCW